MYILRSSQEEGLLTSLQLPVENSLHRGFFYFYILVSRN